MQSGTSRTVIVVGAGNAALCAAIAARETGAEVTVFERAPENLRGGNTAFTAGAMRFAYDGVEDIKRLSPGLTDEQLENTDFGSYPKSSFYDDIARVTQHRADPEMAATLVENSLDTLAWMQDHGVRFLPIYGRQAFQVDGRYRFWGGLTLEVVGGGPGLVEFLTREGLRLGISVEYSSRVTDLIVEQDTVVGVVVHGPAGIQRRLADSVVLASGGFQANTEWRTRYLGPGWDLAKVRGTQYNTGDGLRMALDIGASSRGHWSGAHAVAWDRNAPEFGDLRVGDGFQKHSYPFGIVVNQRGERFLDEGADFRNYTYAMYGRRIIEQPDQMAWQIFDAKVEPLLREEYRIREVTRVKADTLEELAARMDDLDVPGFLQTVADFNKSVRTDIPFDPNVKDGRSTQNLSVPKSNWANPLDTPPYQAFAVTCGITFTFGGLRVDAQARVLDGDGRSIPGLFAAGELVGGLFYFNYPGGSGLTNGSVYGRIAGAAAGAAP